MEHKQKISSNDRNDKHWLNVEEGGGKDDIILAIQDGLH